MSTTPSLALVRELLTAGRLFHHSPPAVVVDPYNDGQALDSLRYATTVAQTQTPTARHRSTATVRPIG